MSFVQQVAHITHASFTKEFNAHADVSYRWPRHCNAHQNLTLEHTTNAYADGLDARIVSWSCSRSYRTPHTGRYHAFYITLGVYVENPEFAFGGVTSGGGAKVVFW